MTTAPSGLDETINTAPKRFTRFLRPKQLIGAALALATAAAATVVVVGGDVTEAEAAFGATPPPATDTLCETTRPAEVDWDSLTNNAVNWDPANVVNVVVGVNSVEGDKTAVKTLPDTTVVSAFGDESPYAGNFTYSVVLDNTGDTFDPAIENHPSFHPFSSSSPIVLSGRGSGSSLSLDLPAGCRYVVSVRADGHDLGAAWIRIEDAAHNMDVQKNDVFMVTNDRLPLAQVVVRAFHDFALVNSQFDIGETGLQDFNVTFGDGGEVSVDYFGNPLCTNYLTNIGGDPLTLDFSDLDVDGMPTVDPANPGGNCLTDVDGYVTIKYMPAGKYEVVVVPPDGTDWVQTTTIEGTHIIDVWVEPGDAGTGGEFIGDLDGGTFQVVGFISPTLYPTLMDADPLNDLVYHYPYTPDPTGADVAGCIYNGMLYPTADGVHTVIQDGLDNPDGLAEPLINTYVSLGDVGNFDSMMDMVETDANGCFRFPDVPNGTYQLAAFDYELLYIIGFYNVTVNAATSQNTASDVGYQNGVVDMGPQFLLRWFGWSSGHVFYDSGISKSGVVIPVGDLKDGSASAAANGVRDCLGQNNAGFNYDSAPVADCEPGIINQEIIIRNRDAQIFKTATTDVNGYYEIDNIWSLLFRGQVIEVGAGALDITGHSVHDQFDRNAVQSQGNCPANVEDIVTGVTPGVLPDDCLPSVLGGGLLLASIFQQGKRNTIDFGKLSYLDPSAPNGFFTPGGTGNGGIAGSVTSNTTAAQWDPSKEAVEDNEPGIPDVQVDLYVVDPTCTLVDPVSGVSGVDNPDCFTIPVDSLVTDHYVHPGKDRNGQPCPVPTAGGAPFGPINPTFQGVGDNCTGSWLLGAHTNDGAWDGGFAFGNLSPGYYVVEVTPPPGWQIVKENDMNTALGNEYIPAKPPGGCVGEYHYAQLDEEYASPYDAFDVAGVYNGTAPVRLCNRRLLQVQPFANNAVDIVLMTNGMDANGNNVTFKSNFIENDPNPPVDPYTINDQVWSSSETVSLPGRMFGLVLDDLTMTANQNSLTFGEQAGVVGIPIGIYNHAGTYLTTTWTDENGHYEVLLPSTFSINRATPGGVGPTMYKVVVNDPGPNGDNFGYDPSFITNPNILEVNAGVMTKADTPVLSLAAGPCALPQGTPQLFEVNSVYGTTGALPTDYTISGINLVNASVFMTPLNVDGTVNEAGQLDVTPYSVTTPTPSLTDPTSIYDVMVIDLAAVETALGAMVGPYQVSFSHGTAISESPRNGITFHVLSAPGGTYDLNVITVADQVLESDTVIQDAIDATALDTRTALIVVPPGSYRESLIVDDNMIIQGFGAGGMIGVPTETGPLSLIETPFAFLTGSVVSPFGALLDDRMYLSWEAEAAATTWDGNQGVEVGPAFQFLMEVGDVAPGDRFQIDGFGVTGLRARHGAVHVNGNADNLVISNMAIQANNSSRGGAGINLGVPSADAFDSVTPGLGTFSRFNGRIVPDTIGGDLIEATTVSDASNDNVVIRNNRVLQNGGTALAGGIGIFNGNNNYTIVDNDICGNYAAEYGGAISQVGESTGTIARNAIQNNEAFDEGGAILLGSELNFAGHTNPLGAGIGDVTIDSNQFLYNLAGDDGGAIMVLHGLNSPIRIVNNVIADNVATDLGGGIHLFDAGNATIVHNTIANNLSTNSAVDALGFQCVGDVYVGGGIGANTCPRPGGLTTQPNSVGFNAMGPLDGSTFANPVLQNNIFWNNQAGYVIDQVVPAAGNLVSIFGLSDMGVYDGVTNMGPAMELNPEHSVLSVPYGVSATNSAGIDPQFVLDLPLEIQSQAAPVFGNTAQITMVWPALPPIQESDYHLASGASPAADLGLLGVEMADIDRELRPFAGPISNNTLPDAGADEVGASSLTGLMFFSTTRNIDNNIGIADTDVQSWSTLGINTVLTGVATAGGAAADVTDIDGLHVLPDSAMLISFLGNNVLLPDGPGGVNGTFRVEDEDIVHYDGLTDTWTLAVDGSMIGLTGMARDIDALHRLADGSYLVSFAGFATVPTQSASMGVPDEDVVHMIPVASTAGVVTGAYFEPYFSGTTLGLDGVAAGDVDGVALVGNSLLLSMKGTNIIGDFTVRDEDVVACGGLTLGLGGLWTCGIGNALYFEGQVDGGLAANNDVNAVSGPLAG